MGNLTKTGLALGALAGWALLIICQCRGVETAPFVATIGIIIGTLLLNKD